MQGKLPPPKEEVKSVEIRRPDANHSWGICYAVLPNGPEILKIMNESPAFGHLRSGQIIKSVNGQSVLGLKREDIAELLNIDEEVVVLEVTESTPSDAKVVTFGREYGRGSVEPGSYQRTYRRNSEMPFSTQRQSSNVCVAMPTNLPNCRDEFERIHLERKQSRELTIKELEKLRIQRSGSVEVLGSERRRSSIGGSQVLQTKLSNGKVQNNQTVNGLEKLSETPNEDISGITSLRYRGVNIPSRSFRALASLMGMDPDGTNVDQISTKPATQEPCRTVIDVRAAAEELKNGTLRRTSVDSNGSLPPHHSVPLKAL
nr:pdz domain containing protein [Hymenolepis microstoma]